MIKHRLPAVAITTALLAAASFVNGAAARAQESGPVPAPAPAAPAAHPLVGKPAPDFTLPNQNDSPQTLSGQRGRWVVLAFYPSDKTRG